MAESCQGLAPFLIEQYASEVVSYSSQYGSDNALSYVCQNILGEPTVYPESGDSPQAFSFRTHGHWWSENCFKRVPGCLKSFHSRQEFIEVKFEKEVYPLEVHIFENYNPGSLSRIIGFNDQRWKVLWECEEGEEEVVLGSRIFSPALSTCNFLIKTLVLEVNTLRQNYYSEFDALLLVGSLAKCQPTIPRPAHATDGHSDEGTHNFSRLPKELQQKIFSYLNLDSLSRASQVSRIFQKCSYDSYLYRLLDFQPIWFQVSDLTLDALKSRCQDEIRWCNLSWCKFITPPALTRFLMGLNELRVLRLDNCTFLNDENLEFIGSHLASLQELSVAGCLLSPNVSQLVELTTLNLYNTRIQDDTLRTILRSCTRLKNLCLGSCFKLANLDGVLLALPDHSRLETLDLWRAKTLSAEGVMTLAERCPCIADLDLGWCLNVDASTGCIKELLSKCGPMRRLILTSLRSVTDGDLEMIALKCRGLEQLDVSGNREITEEQVFRILCACPKIKLLDISFSTKISKSSLSIWRMQFPLVQYKRSTAPL